MELNNIFKENYHFIIYEQNNSGGEYIITPNLAHYVIFHVPQSIEQIDLYSKYSDYFEEIMLDLYNDYNTDCECCGDRWDRYQIIQQNELEEFIKKRENDSITIHCMDTKKCIYSHYNEYDNILKYKFDVEEIFLNILKRKIREYDYSYYDVKKIFDKRRLGMSREETYHAYHKNNKDDIICKMYSKYNRIDWYILSKNKLDQKYNSDSQFILLQKLFSQSTDIIKKILQYV